MRRSHANSISRQHMPTLLYKRGPKDEKVLGASFVARCHASLVKLFFLVSLHCAVGCGVSHAS